MKNSRIIAKGWFFISVYYKSAADSCEANDVSEIVEKEITTTEVKGFKWKYKFATNIFCINSIRFILRFIFEWKKRLRNDSEENNLPSGGKLRQARS